MHTSFSSLFLVPNLGMLQCRSPIDACAGIYTIEMSSVAELKATHAPDWVPALTGMVTSREVAWDLPLHWTPIGGVWSHRVDQRHLWDFNSHYKARVAISSPHQHFFKISYIIIKIRYIWMQYRYCLCGYTTDIVVDMLSLLSSGYRSFAIFTHYSKFSIRIIQLS
jgi:hypothetical protein